METKILDSGNLEITATPAEREGLLAHYTEAGKGYPGADLDILESLREDCNLDRVEPEWIGALTAAPILSDGLDYPDDGDPRILPGSWVWWFPDYMVRDPWEELAREGQVIFTWLRNRA